MGSPCLYMNVLKIVFAYKYNILALAASCKWHSTIGGHLLVRNHGHQWGGSTLASCELRCPCCVVDGSQHSTHVCGTSSIVLQPFWHHNCTDFKAKTLHMLLPWWEGKQSINLTGIFHHNPVPTIACIEQCCHSSTMISYKMVGNGYAEFCSLAKADYYFWSKSQQCQILGISTAVIDHHSSFLLKDWIDPYEQMFSLFLRTMKKGKSLRLVSLTRTFFAGLYNTPWLLIAFFNKQHNFCLPLNQSLLLMAAALL